MRDPQGNPIAAFVLAGGRSRRFGRDKALARWRHMPLLEHVLEALSGFPSRAVIAGRARDYGVDVPVLVDIYPDRGPLGGIFTGLSHSQADWNLFVACDLPRLQRPLLELLCASIEPAREAVVPRVDGRWVPTLALYRRTLLPLLAEALREGRLSLQTVLREARVRTVEEPELKRVDPSLASFINANTPEVLAALEET